MFVKCYTPCRVGYHSVIWRVVVVLWVRVGAIL